jgi:hypothetical protein
MRTDKHGRPYHPAKYSKEVLAKLSEILWDESYVLDPFAGVGLIHTIPGINSVGVEIEPEWADMHPQTIRGDATKLLFPDESFPFVVTSCCYGNRMSDSHDAKDSCKSCDGKGTISHGRGRPRTTCKKCRGTGLSIRNTYTHSLDRKLHPNNAGHMPFTVDTARGFPYRELHRLAWREVFRVLRTPTSEDDPMGRFVLNVSNFIKDGEIVNVAGWHRWTLRQIGFELLERHVVSTRRFKHGANRDLRVPHEFIYVLRKPPLA